MKIKIEVKIKKRWKISHLENKIVMDNNQRFLQEEEEEEEERNVK